MVEQPNTSDKAGDEKQPDKRPKRARRGFWRWLILRMERKMHQRRVRRERKKSDENPEAKASRRTAAATVWIAIFTVVLAAVGIFTLIEVIQGGTDTHNLAIAATDQATWTQRLSENMKTQADRTEELTTQTKDLAGRMKDQADQTKTIAEQAKIQAGAANSSAATEAKELELAQRPWVTADLTLRRPLEKNGATMGIDIGVTLKNTGHSPAVHVITHTEFRRFEFGVEKTAIPECTGFFAANHESDVGDTLFPGEERVEIPDTEGTLEIKADGFPRSDISFQVVECIQYEFAFGGKPHNTLTSAWVGSYSPEQGMRLTYLDATTRELVHPAVKESLIKFLTTAD